MIIVNECRVSQDGKYLTIEAAVDNLSYYDTVYIDSVYIDTNETYISTGQPSEKAIYKYTFEAPEVEDSTAINTYRDDTNGHVIYQTKGNLVKKIRIILSDIDLSGISNKLFFVYIKAAGLTVEVPCGMDNEYTIGVATYLKPLYNMIMGYIKELNNDCSVPRNFINLILRLKAFIISLKTGHYIEALKWWEKFFNGKIVLTSKGCGCNGFN